MYNTEMMKFIYWEQASRDTIDFKKSYVDLAGDLVAGLLLSQIVYWHLPSKETGKTKLRVKKDGHLWIAKGRSDWWDEIRITDKQFDRASNILVKKGLIEKKTFKFNGSPTIHTRLIWETFLPRLDDIIYSGEEEESEETDEEALGDMVIPQRVKRKLPKGEERNYPKGKKEITQKGISLTESTAEITKKITSKNLSIKDSKNNVDSRVNEEEEKKIDRPIDDKLILQNKISKKKNLPIPVAKPMMIHTQRLIDDGIDIEDIISTYYANKEVINQYQFGNILSNVLYETKGKIRNIRGLLHTAIKNYFKDINEVEHLKESKPKEIIPDWLKERKHEIKEPQDTGYNLEGARDRFSDIFNF